MAASVKKWIRDAVSYWSSIVCETDIGVDWIDAYDRCWRCAHKRTLQRCHIVPKSLGGADSTDNIIPLCSSCHDQQPDVIDPDETWRWIKETCADFYDQYHIQAGIEMARLRGVDIDSLDEDLVREIMFTMTGRHFGQDHGTSMVKPTTVAWALQEAARRMVNES